jgi:putative ABC transport system permease protein
MAYAPHLATSAHHRFRWNHLPWWLIVTAMALAALTATLAARRPARSLARIPIVAALSGRPDPAPAPHRRGLPGIVLLVIGPLCLAMSGGWGNTSGTGNLWLLVGIVATSIGLLLAAPASLALLGRVAGRTPISVRLALRDLTRYRSRSGPALAATSFAVFLAVIIALVATGRYADPLDYFGPNLPSNQAVLYSAGYSPGGGGGPGAPGTSPAPQSSAALQAGAARIGALLGRTSVVPLQSADVALTQQTSQGGGKGAQGNIYVATPDLLRHFGINPSQIDPTALLLTSRPGLAATSGLQLLNVEQTGPSHCSTGACVADPKIQTLNRLPADTSDPNLLVTTYAVHRLGLQVGPAAWLIEAPHSLTAAEKSMARQAAVGAGLTIETKNQDPSLDELRNYATGAGVLLALGVLAMTLGLIRSETAGDLRTLTATGASTRTRRNITGATAGAIGLVAALIGTATAYLATVAFFRAQLSERMSHAPALDLLLILVALPLTAAAAGWLFAGREPPAIARQPVE